MIQFYTGEVGVDLIFTLKDSNGDPVIDTPAVGWPKLYVENLPTSPITLSAGVNSGEYHHLTTAGEWPVGADEPVHYYPAYIEFKNLAATKIILTDDFLIAVILKPTENL